MADRASFPRRPTAVSLNQMDSSNWIGQGVTPHRRRQGCVGRIEHRPGLGASTSIASASSPCAPPSVGAPPEGSCACAKAHPLRRGSTAHPQREERVRLAGSLLGPARRIARPLRVMEDRVSKVGVSSVVLVVMEQGSPWPAHLDAAADNCVILQQDPTRRTGPCCAARKSVFAGSSARAIR